MTIEDVLRAQGGVIARRQVLAEGGDDNLIERRIRRNEWRPLHPGVYVDHTGRPSPEQRRMGAVLHAWPAALAGESALVAHGVRNVDEREVRVVVDRSRRVGAPAGVAITRVKGLQRRAQWNRTPPRLRLEEAALEAASRRWAATGEAAAVALLADVCQQRLTTPDRLATELRLHSRLRGRSFLGAVLDDVASGAFSLLERRYLADVERAHGLPRGDRQRGFGDGTRHGYRDVAYPAQALLVELDGRLGHEFAADQWADLARDLKAATDQQLTVRLGWGLVADACTLAELMGRLLRARGWTGDVRRCRRCPPNSGTPPAPGADDPPLTGRPGAA